MSKKRDGKQMAEETIRMSRGISPVAAEIISEIITGFRNPNRPPGYDGTHLLHEYILENGKRSQECNHGERNEDHLDRRPAYPRQYLPDVPEAV